MKRYYQYFVVVWMAVFVTTACFAQQQPTNNLAKDIDQLIATYAEYGKFSGAVLVAKEGEVIYKKGVGLANMEWNIPNEADTKFRLASVTKQFTAMLVVQLAAQNKIDLQAPITTYLPNYPKERGDKITIHHLLTHTSGLPNYTSFDNYRDVMRNHMTPTELVASFADSTLRFAPGERFEYSNAGYALLGAIIEQVTGLTYAEVLREQITEPLGMHSTGFENSEDIIHHRAAGYYKNGNTYKQANYIDMSVAYAAGGMYSTVEDLYLWEQALYTEKLLPRRYLDMIFEPYTSAWGGHYGYGWLLGRIAIGNTNDHQATIEHDGVINGFTSSIIRLPERRSSVILLNNTSGAPLRQMSSAICAILEGKSYDFPKRSLANTVLAIIKEQGLEKGLQFYHDNKNTAEYKLDEGEMNMAGYDLLQSGLQAAAKAVFALNIEANPNSANAYDSYGEVLMEMGDKDKAIEYYKKSLYFNPRNDNAIKMLAKLGVLINKSDLYLLQTDDTWAKEIFIFPLRFAPEIPFLGKEEAHFPRGWRDEKSAEFWSYSLVWQIDTTAELTTEDVVINLERYFDGLMQVVNRDKSVELPHTTAEIRRDKSTSTYIGTLDIYDAFVTQEKMSLHIQIEQYYCAEQQQDILWFKISPKTFEHEIWKTLGELKLRANMCKK